KRGNSIMTKGFLVLETGDIFEGEYIGAEIETEGEIVFNTSMTGYQEILTNPSNYGQIMMFTYPTIGSYGVHPFDNESKDIAVSAVIVNDICHEPSHYQSSISLSEQLKKENIPVLTNIDTRTLVSIIRKNQSIKGKITKLAHIPSKWEKK